MLAGCNGGVPSGLTRSPLPLCPGAARPPLQPQTGTETGRERARARGGAFLEATPIARPRDGGGASSLREPGNRQRGVRGVVSQVPDVGGCGSVVGVAYRQCSPPPLPRHLIGRRVRSPGTASPRPWRRHLPRPPHPVSQLTTHTHTQQQEESKGAPTLLMTTPTTLLTGPPCNVSSYSALSGWFLYRRHLQSARGN